MSTCVLSHDTILQVIDVRPTEGGVEIATRKKDASPHSVSSGFAKTTIRPRSGSRRVLGAAAKQAKRGYRPDLRTVSVSFSFRSIYIYIFPLCFLCFLHRRA